MEEPVAASEPRLRTVITGAPVVLFTLDRAGVCTVSEGRGLARLGLKPGQVVGRHFAEVLAAFVSDAERAAGYFRRALAGEKLTWLGVSGDMIYECRLNPMVDADGTPSGVIGIATDVTERERAETARLALERKLLEAKRLESLGVLAGGVAHDFNNLLVNVLGNASLAAAELPDDSPVRDSLRRIEAAARRGSELTRQMLAYAGKEPVSLQGVDVNAAVEDTIELLNVSIPGADIGAGSRCRAGPDGARPSASSCRAPSSRRATSGRRRSRARGPSSSSTTRKTCARSRCTCSKGSGAAYWSPATATKAWRCSAPTPP